MKLERINTAKGFCAKRSQGIPELHRNRGRTFLMLQQLANLKCFVQDLGSHESYLTGSEWAVVKMMVEVLQIPHAATIYFQKQNHTLGE